MDAVVEGSVTRAGSQVKITAQLIDAARDRHLWADSFQRELKDVLVLQGEVARAIAGEIGVRLTPQERLRLADKKTVNPEAYEAYLKGQHHLFRRTAPDALRVFSSIFGRPSRSSRTTRWPMPASRRPMKRRPVRLRARSLQRKPTRMRRRRRCGPCSSIRRSASLMPSWAGSASYSIATGRRPRASSGRRSG